MAISKQQAIATRQGKIDQALGDYENAARQHSTAQDRPTAMRAIGHLRKAVRLWEEIAEFRK